VRLFDYIYYCIYRYVLRTPDRAAIDAWPNIFIGFTFWVHIMFVYETVAMIMTGGLWHLPRTPVFIMLVILTMVALFWHYVWRGNGARVVHDYQKRGHAEKYARVGAFLWYESLLLPFAWGGIFILSQKLTGWPPHL